MLEALEARFVKDEVNDFRINYYILEDNGYYGIGAEKVQNDKVVDKDNIRCIFETEKEALGLLRTLADTTVTPFVLAEVIDELMN